MTNKIVIAELTKGTINPATAELVSAAQSMGGEITVVVPCTDATTADAAASYDGVGKVIAVKSEVFAGNDSSGWASALDSAIPNGTVLCLATARSKDVASRLAARRGLSIVQDVVSIEGSNLTSPIYSGKANQTVTANGDVVLTVRANVFNAVGSGSSNDVSVVDASGDCLLYTSDAADDC